MNQNAQHQPSRIVLVVGLDLSELSEHLLAVARDLAAWADKGELHVVHVVPPQPLRERLGEPVHSDEDPGLLALKEAAWCELESLCRHVVEGSPAHWTVHVRVGRAGDELARVAKDVGADFVIVEAHGRPASHWMFQRSVVARTARCSPCPVLTIRDPSQGGHAATQQGPMQAVSH
jgi:nucleotide-binding universal stress UspA family protein